MARKLVGPLAFLGVFLAAQASWSQTTGTISGKITDSQTGQALPGAIVFIKGTSLGASTDLNGKYTITGVPAGIDTLRVSYVGYTARIIRVDVKPNASLTMNAKLVAVGVKSREVVVTAQASGQNAAINQQLSSQNIVNVVSAARIRQLPDANAAESVGRLPGIYLIRQGGEGAEVAIRGLQPKYNEVTIDGVQMAATGSPATINGNPTSSGTRAVDLSMISSSMLSGIEVYKTVTPDMDAAAIGGVVNFQIREAQRTPSGAPEISLTTQGGYDNLLSQYNDYKFTGSIGDRFLNDKFGILAQGVVERVNLTADNFGGSYYLGTKIFGIKNPVYLSSLNTSFVPSARRRYDAALTMDYRLPEGKIDFMNFFSRGITQTQTYSQDYNIYTGNDINFGVGNSPNTLNTLIDLLDYKQNTPLLNMHIRLSHSYSENIYPGSWRMTFSQGQAGINGIPPSANPIYIGKVAFSKINPDTLLFSGFNTSNSYSMQRNITGSIDFTKDLTFSNLVTAKLKFGGMYRYTYRNYTYADGTGTLYNPGNGDARAYIIQTIPHFQKYGLNPNGTDPLPLTLFEDNNFNYGNFLNGNYGMGPGTNSGLISQVIDTVVSFMRDKPGAVAADYSPDVYGSDANNYHGNEYESAGYIMATLNIGPKLTLIPGVRYQGLRTVYEASVYPNASAGIYYPNTWPHTDSTIAQFHGYWLPDMIVKYQPLSWLTVRAAYTNTLSYPDYSSIVPRIDIFASSVTWNNQLLRPSRSQNYDLGLSMYNNSVGLFTVDGFLKQIDNMIFNQGNIYITDPAVYGLPPDTKGASLSTDINDPYRVNVLGAELDWQTHFWYLPGFLNSLVLNVNYTHIFSGAKYPYVITITYNGYPPKPPVHLDTNYTDRLIDQPDNIVNLSLGYDYQGFSAVVSMIYQADVFSGTNFWPELRQTKAHFLSWDMTATQNLPWFGLQLYLNLSNINSANDITVIQGSGFPTSESDYGMTADLGLRWRL